MKIFNMRAHFSILVFTLFCFCGIAQQAQQTKTFADKTKSSITYAMEHPLHSWEGVSREINSVILTDASKNVITQAAVSVKISSFDSQNANRDSHCIEVTEAIKYPNISFASTSIKQNVNALEISGKLTFHGVTKEITLTAEKKTENNQLQITGSFSINMTDYNIDPPSLMAMETDEVIKLKFTLVY